RRICDSVRRQLMSTIVPYTTLFRSWQLILRRVNRKDWPMAGYWRKVLACAALAMLASCAREATTQFDELLPEETGVTFRNDIVRSEEHTSELQSREKLVCSLLLERK